MATLVFTYLTHVLAATGGFLVAVMIVSSRERMARPERMPHGDDLFRTMPAGGGRIARKATEPVDLSTFPSDSRMT